MNLLSTSHKVQLGEEFGVLTRVLYLSPASESGRNLCPSSTEGCRAACLGHSSGFMVYPTHKAARISKSQWLQADRDGFVAQLHREIAQTVRKALREGLQPAIRLNGSSDIGWEKIAPGLFSGWPDVHFYDYTKRYERMRRSIVERQTFEHPIDPRGWPPNYRLTFSRSGENDKEVDDVLTLGGNVAVVFDSAESFPETYLGRPVVSGEVSDYRYGDPENVVIALKARGAARRDTSGFVIHV